MKNSWPSLIKAGQRSCMPAVPSNRSNSDATGTQRFESQKGPKPDVFHLAFLSLISKPAVVISCLPRRGGEFTYTGLRRPIGVHHFRQSKPSWAEPKVIGPPRTIADHRPRWLCPSLARPLHVFHGRTSSIPPGIHQAKSDPISHLTQEELLDSPAFACILNHTLNLR
ncbi:hypothetical protein VTG60DRAFT_4010 [Thermothelomyces hinnuleus]